MVHKVTIGIPTYNRASKLEIALNSVVNQSYEELEILISDNFSNDHTSDLCNSYASRDSRIVYHRQTKNVGPHENFLYLYYKNHSNYFMWLSDDDYIDLHYIEKCMEFYSKNHDYALVAGMARYYSNKKFHKYGRKINVLDKDNEERTISFYRQTLDNGVFYGIYNTKMIPKIIFPSSWAGDQIFIANIAYFGKIKTLDNVFIHRSLDGISNNMKQVIKNLKLPKIQYYLPHYTMIYEIFVNSFLIEKSNKSKIKKIIFSILSVKSYFGRGFVASIKYIFKMIFLN